MRSRCNHGQFKTRRRGSANSWRPAWPRALRWSPSVGLRLPSSCRWALDTNIVSELRKPRPHGAVVAWIQSTEDADLHLSAVTLGEIQAGIEVTRDQDASKVAEIEAWLELVAQSHNVLPMDGATFRIWARLIHHAPAIGHVVRGRDDRGDRRRPQLHGGDSHVADFAHFGVRVSAIPANGHRSPRHDRCAACPGVHPPGYAVALQRAPARALHWGKPQPPRPRAATHCASLYVDLAYVGGQRKSHVYPQSTAHSVGQVPLSTDGSETVSVEDIVGDLCDRIVTVRARN
jgi:predicted nucleic acid-binding protein